MSYCRQGPDSDVYVIAESGPYWTCFCVGRPAFGCATRTSMLNHLAEHHERGDKVPVKAVVRLWRELQEKGNV